MMTTLLNRLNDMPVSLRNAVVQQAWTTADTSERAHMASIESLSAPLYSLVAQDPAPEVRIALLVNDDVPEDLINVVLDQESRANVLAAALNRAHRGTSRRAHLLNTVQTRMKVKPSVTLAASLLQADSYSPDVAADIRACLVSSSRVLPARTHSAFVHLLGQASDSETAELLPHVFRLDYLEALLGRGPAITHALFVDVTRRLTERVAAEDSVVYGNAHMRHAKAVSATRLLTRTLTNSGGDDTWVSVLEQQAAQVKIPELQQELSKAAAAARDALHAADDNTSESLTTWVSLANDGDLTAMVHVAQHPDSTEAQWRFALGRLVHRDSRKAVELARARGDLYELLRRNVAALHANGVLAPALGQTDDERGETALRVLLDPQFAVDSHLLAGMDAVLLEYAGRHGLLALPWPRTTALVQSERTWQVTAGDLFSQECLGRLTSPEHWAAFASLSQSWTASTGDLFDAVESLCEGPALE